MAAPAENVESQLVKGLGLFDSTTLVIGSMIGSGIFIVSADIARQVNSPALLLSVWLVATVMTMVAALCYGELAAMMPRAGGQYVYLREAYGPLTGFLFGWTVFMVIQTGTIGAVAVGAAKFTGVFVPAISATNYVFGDAKFGVTTQQSMAIAVLVSLTWINTRGIRAGAIVQNLFTVSKTAGLLGLIALGFLVGRTAPADAANFGAGWTMFWSGAGWNLESFRLVGVAMVGALFAADSWTGITFTAGEVRNPKRNIPLSLALGTGSVCVLYMAANWVYINALPLAQIQNAPSDRVGTAVAIALVGPVGEALVATAIIISALGCVNGILLAGPRVYFAMALDGLFFKRAAVLHPEFKTPVFALWIQCFWAVVLTLSGSYNDLLDYVIFAALFFYILTIGGIFVLRRTRPGAERPYRAIGYPVVPALYLAVATAIEILLLFYKPRFTWPGVVIVLSGVPVYLFWRKREVRN